MKSRLYLQRLGSTHLIIRMMFFSSYLVHQLVQEDG